MVEAKSAEKQADPAAIYAVEVLAEALVKIAHGVDLSSSDPIAGRLLDPHVLQDVQRTLVTLPVKDLEQLQRALALSLTLVKTASDEAVRDAVVLKWLAEPNMQDSTHEPEYGVETS